MPGLLVLPPGLNGWFGATAETCTGATCHLPRRSRAHTITQALLSMSAIRRGWGLCWLLSLVALWAPLFHLDQEKVDGHMVHVGSAEAPRSPWRRLRSHMPSRVGSRHFQVQGSMVTLVTLEVQA